MKEFLKMMTSLAFVLVMIWLLFTLCLGVKMAPNDDMKPTIRAEDIVIYYRINKQPVLQDVVVIRKNDTDYIGRVIATGGDEVNIPKEGGLYINGYQTTEEDIYFDTIQYEGFVDYPVKLAGDEYFLLVDKRQYGEDSRYYGVVKSSEIKGVVIGSFRKNMK